MQVSYQLNSDELDNVLLKSIKELFKGKNIEIVISDEDEEDRKFGIILSESYTNSKIVSEKDFLKALNENWDKRYYLKRY